MNPSDRLFWIDADGEVDTGEVVRVDENGTIWVKPVRMFGKNEPVKLSVPYYLSLQDATKAAAKRSK